MSSLISNEQGRPLIQHVTFSTRGGAGRVVAELNKGLLAKGFASEILATTPGDLKTVFLKRPILGAAGLTDFYVLRRSQSQPLFSLFRDKIQDRHISARINVDCIPHFHWLSGVLPARTISSISSATRRSIWTLHDMNSFTGGCHHAHECQGFMTSCVSCPQVRRPFQRLVSSQLAEKAAELEGNENVLIVTPSNWLRDKASKSTIFRNKGITVIPNPVDTQLFQPAHPLESGNDADPFVVGVNATKLDDPEKGVNEVIESVRMLQPLFPKKRIQILAIGGNPPVEQNDLLISTGQIQCRQTLAMKYREMSVFVSMSKAEVFPMSVAEGISSGLPTIVRSVGGMPEMIQHERSGYVVSSSIELADRLKTLISNDEVRKTMGQHARRFAISNLSTERVVSRYLEVYGLEGAT